MRFRTSQHNSLMVSNSESDYGIGMSTNKNNIAIIPARSGSKGLPDKNIRELKGRPLLAFAIEAARRSGIFDTVMVSTDSEEYRDIAIRNGADVPFLRSVETSTDNATSWEVVDEVLNKYYSIGKEFGTFCLLQPTTPLRTSEDIVNAYQAFYEKGAKVVVSVCTTDHSPLLAGTIGNKGSLYNFIPEDRLKRRQDLGNYYRPNGAIYIVDTKIFSKDFYLYDEGSFSYIMPRNRSVDIDTIDDFNYVEYLLNKEEKT